MLSTPGQFGPVLLPQVSKNDDKVHCFLKLFGFIQKSIMYHMPLKAENFTIENTLEVQYRLLGQCEKNRRRRQGIVYSYCIYMLV